MKCPHCTSEIPDNSKFCPVCGQKADTPAGIVCPNCQTALPADAKFCETCGTAVSQPEPPAEPVCPSCQAAISPGSTFCTKCGHRLSDAATPAPEPQVAAYQPPGQQPAYQQPQQVYQPQQAYQQPQAPAYQQQAPAYQQQPPKKKKGWLIALIIVLVLAVAGTGVYFLAGKQIQRMIMGPKKTYLSIEAKALKQNADDMLANAVKFGNKKERSPKGGADLELSLDLNAELLDLDPTLAAILDNLSLKASLLYDNSSLNQTSFLALDFFTGNERLLTLETLHEEDRRVLGQRDLLDKYIEAPLDDLDGLLYDMDLDVDTDDVLGFNQLAAFDLDIDKAAMQKSIPKIIDIMLDNIDEVKHEKNQSLAVGGVENKYDAYTVTLTSDKAKTMLIEILEHLHQDKEIFNLISNIVKATDPYSYYNLSFFDYQSTIEDMIKDIKDSKDDEVLTFNQIIYIDKDDNIHGREIKFLDDRNKPILQYKQLNPVDGNKEAFQFNFEAEDGSFDFISSYTVAGDKKTGTASLSVDGKKELDIDFKDLHQKTIGQNDFILGEADFSFSAGYDAPDKVTYSAREEAGRYRVDLGIPPFGKISIGYRSIDSRDVAIPRIDPANLIDITDIYSFDELLTEDTMDRLAEILEKLGLDDLFPDFDDDYDYDFD